MHSALAADKQPQNKLSLDEQICIKLLIVDRREYNIGGNRRAEDKNPLFLDIADSIKEINKAKIAQDYQPNKYYVEIVNRYEDALFAADKILFDFFLFYKLRYENGKDAADLIKALADQSDIDPFYLVAYRSRDSADLRADTNLERLTSIKDEYDCASDTERAIFRCKEYAIAGTLNHVILVGDLYSTTMRTLMETFTNKRHVYKGLGCAVYENGSLVEIKQKRKFLFF